jgi:hypothetical protein
VPDGRALRIAWSLITNHIPRRYCVGRDRGTGLPFGIGYAARSHLVAVGVGVGAITLGRLDFNRRGSPGLEETACRVGSLPWLVGIEPEVIQRAPANSRGILILLKRFCLPGYGASGLIDSQRSAAISMVLKVQSFGQPDS